MVFTTGGAHVQTAIRPVLGHELESEDGRVDHVAVDAALRGERVELNRWELDEVCAALHRLLFEYHTGATSIGRCDDEGSPFAMLKALLIEAYGPDFEVWYLRYRNKVNLRSKRAQRKAVAA